MTQRCGHKRRSACRSQRRHIEGRRMPILFVGGPLDDVQIAVSRFDAGNQRLGFAVPTNRGVAQALYERGVRSRWQFVRLDGGMRRTGHPTKRPDVIRFHHTSTKDPED